MNSSQICKATDYIIWREGLRAGGGELDFLRALHGLTALSELSDTVDRIIGPRLLMMSSIWIDKYPLCSITSDPLFPGNRRELGDLAVVVRRRSPKGLAARMWLMQAKLNHANWTTGKSSTKEIDLYERCPEFELFRSQHWNAPSLGRFNFQGTTGFGILPNPPAPFLPFWSYLLLAPDSQTGWKNGSPMAHQWPSAGNVHRTSYTEGIVQMSSGVANSDWHFGARVDVKTSYPEWRRLFLTLWKDAGQRLSTKLPGGNWKNSVFNSLYSQFGTAHTAQFDSSGVVVTHYYSGGKHPPESLVKSWLEQINDDHGLFPPFDGGNNDGGGSNEIESDDGNGGGGGINFLIVDLISD